MSANNTASYLALAGMDDALAWMTGIALVIFSSTSLTSAHLFLTQAGYARWLSLPFIIAGILVIVFSIFATLSVNYDRFISSGPVKAEMREKTDRARGDLMAARESPGKWAMGSIDRLLDLSERSGESWNNSMKTIAEMSAALSENEKNTLDGIFIETLPATFFGFMLGLKNAGEKKYFLDFFMIAIPAVFYDLIAPLAVTVVLFLMGRGAPGPQPVKAQGMRPDMMEMNARAGSRKEGPAPLPGDAADATGKARREKTAARPPKAGNLQGELGL
jgi:hypothetical protein